MARFVAEETVKISDGKGGYKVISKGKFDPKAHKEFAAPGGQDAEKLAAEKAAAEKKAATK